MIFRVLLFACLSSLAISAQGAGQLERVGRCLFPTKSPDARPQGFPELNCHDFSAPICLSVSGCHRSRIFYDMQIHRINNRIASGKNDPYEYGLCTTMEDCHELRSVMTEMLEMVSNRIKIQETEPTRTSLTGAVFTRVNEYPELGEAWRDPSGLIWGGIIPRDEQFQAVMNLTKREGARYCASLGARLPTREEFAALRSYLLSDAAPMGRWQPVIPEIELQYSFWTSTAAAESEFSYIFIGANWDFSEVPDVPRNPLFVHTVRCVRR